MTRLSGAPLDGLNPRTSCTAIFVPGGELTRPGLGSGLESDGWSTAIYTECVGGAKALR